jgi:hypothetical protein
LYPPDWKQLDIEHLRGAAPETPRPTALGRRLLAAVERPFDALQIKPQATPAAAESHRAEFAGVGVNPVALDAELLGDRGSVGEAGGSGAALAFGEDLGDPLGDQLDIARVKTD